MQYLQNSTRIEIHSLIDLDCNSLHMEDAAGRYLEYEDDTDPSIPASIISIPQLVTDLANKSQEPEELEATTPESEIVYPPVTATFQAPSHLDKVVTFFEALPESDLETIGRHPITFSSVERQLRIFRSGVNQYKESRK